MAKRPDEARPFANLQNERHAYIGPDQGWQGLIFSAIPSVFQIH
jgi:hypothetical protein